MPSFYLQRKLWIQTWKPAAPEGPCSPFSPDPPCNENAGRAISVKNVLVSRSSHVLCRRTLTAGPTAPVAPLLPSGPGAP